MSHSLADQPTEILQATDDMPTQSEQSSPVGRASAPPPAATNRARSAPVPWWRRVLPDTAYNLTALALAVPAFVLMVAGLSIGGALAITLFGFPILALTTFVARGFAHVERSRIRRMLFTDAPTPSYHRGRPDAGWLRRAMAPLTDPQSWLDVVWSIVSFVTAIATFVVAVVWWSLAVGGVTYWFWQQWIPNDPEQNETLAELIGLGDGRTAESLLMLAIGVAAALTLPLAMRLTAQVQSSIGRILLSSRAELQQEMVHLNDTRDAARAAEAGSLRRLERDLHDGPQQGLVRLTMDLGRARKQMDTDPDLARATIEQALIGARATVEELRQLSRGIAPPILVDRGLLPALDELASRSTIPVTTHLAVDGELPPHVETAAYYVASEALTNVAKHSGADRVELTARRKDGVLLIEVADNGTGGAAVAKGHGLAGLDQRVRAADGTLSIDSPVGGPTTVRAEIACG